MESRGLQPRRASLRVLKRVFEEGAFTNLVLGPELDREALVGPDRALATTLVQTTLRHRDFLRDLLLEASRSGRLPKEVEALLLLGASQLLLLDRVPDHAALDTSVRLAKDQGAGRYSGLVNGLLRTLQRQRQEALSRREAADAPLSWLGPAPAWLCQRWEGRLGEAQARALQQRLSEPAPIDIRLLDVDNLDRWAEELGADAIEGAPPRLRLSGGHPPSLPGFAQGAWIVQDRNAARVVSQLPRGGRRVLDVCAAPGGKTSHLAQIQPEAELHAVELHPHRAQLVQDTLERCGQRATVHCGDARELLPELGTFDRIVLDAPCTGLGTLRRHPEIGIRRKAKAPKQAQRLQKELLEVAVEALSPGGFLIYAVCSLEPEEGEQVIQSLLARHEELSLRPTADFAEGQGWLGLDGDGDGFFLALVEKRA